MHECGGRCSRQTSNDLLGLRMTWTVKMRLPINIALSTKAEYYCGAMWQNKRDKRSVATALVVSNVMRQVSHGQNERFYSFLCIHSKHNSQVLETHSIRSSLSHLILPICCPLLVARTMCKWNSDIQDSTVFRSRKNSTFYRTLSHSVFYKILRANKISRSRSAYYKNAEHMFSVYFVCADRGVCSSVVARQKETKNIEATEKCQCCLMVHIGKLFSSWMAYATCLSGCGPIETIYSPISILSTKWICMRILSAGKTEMKQEKGKIY